MSIRLYTPCDVAGICPYNAEYFGTCEYWCGIEEPQDNPMDWEEDDDYPF